MKVREEGFAASTCCGGISSLSDEVFGYCDYKTEDMNAYEQLYHVESSGRCDASRDVTVKNSHRVVHNSPLKKAFNP